MLKPVLCVLAFLLAFCEHQATAYQLYYFTGHASSPKNKCPEIGRSMMSTTVSDGGVDGSDFEIQSDSGDAVTCFTASASHRLVWSGTDRVIMISGAGDITGESGGSSCNDRDTFVSDSWTEACSYDTSDAWDCSVKPDYFEWDAPASGNVIFTVLGGTGQTSVSLQQFNVPLCTGDDDGPNGGGGAGEDLEWDEESFSVDVDNGTVDLNDFLSGIGNTTLTFESSDTDVATVSGAGVLTPKDSGSTIVTAFREGGRGWPAMNASSTFVVSKGGVRIISFGGEDYSFSKNAELTGFGGMTLLWEINQDDNTLALAVTAVKVNNGWVAVGLGSGATPMIGANVVLGWNSGTYSSVGNYEITSRSAGDWNTKVTDGDVSMSSVEWDAATTTVSVLAVFDLGAVDDLESQIVVYATGSLPGSATAAFTQHGSRASENINFLSGASAAVAGELTGLMKLHVALMIVAWGIMLPGGVFAAMFRSQKKVGGLPVWWQLHRSLQIGGVVLSIIAACLAFDFGFEGQGPSEVKAHHAIGITVTLLAILQIVLGVCRPHKPEGAIVPMKRRVWYLLHSNIGRIAVALAFVQMVVGALVVDYITNDNTAVLGAVVSLIVIYGCAFIFAAVKRQGPEDKRPHEKGLELEA